MMSATMEGLRGFLRDGMESTAERGVLYGTGEKGEARRLPVFKEAFEAGRSLLTTFAVLNLVVWFPSFDITVQGCSHPVGIFLCQWW